MANEARIRIGIDGANEVRNAMRLIKGDFESFGSIADKTSGVLKGVANGMVRLGTDFARAANGMKAIDFGQAAEKFKALDDSITRIAVKGGRNVSELKQKFAEFGQAAGVSSGRFADAVRAFDKSTFSGVGDAATAMRELGVAAEDADMSIEEMARLGEDLYQKLGVPADRIGESLKRIKALAADANIAGGLANMANIISRLTQAGGYRMEGGAPRMAATVAALREQGYSPEVATELAGRFIQAEINMPQHLVRRTLRSLTGDKTFEPYVRDPNTGRVQLSERAQELLPEAFRRAPNAMGALMSQFGTNAEGLETSQAYINLDRKRVSSIQHLPDRLRAGGAVPIEDFDKGGSASLEADRQYRRLVGKEGPSESDFSQTSAGQRVRTDLEKGAVETKIGGTVQRLRDKRDAQFKGRRTMQATEDTVTSYMPGVLQDAIQLGSLASSSSSSGAPVVQQQSAALSRAAAALESASIKIDKMPDRVSRAIRESHPTPAQQSFDRQLGQARAN